MILRPRQKVFVDRVCRAVTERGNSLGIGPTGAGKTVMGSAAVAQLIDGGGSAAFIQHRDELVEQNYKTFRKVAPKVNADFVTADRKRWERKGVTFAMIQTLARQSNLEQMPPVDLLAIDEAHHAVSDSYLRVIDHAKKLNPNVKLLGLTATAGRGDKRTLRTVFDNIGDQITLPELIREGHLVPPRAMVIDTGNRDELAAAQKIKSETEMLATVEQIMNKRVINEKIVEEWKKVASDRRTVVFTSTVAHAMDLKDSFVRAGVSAAVVTGDMPDGERRAVLQGLDKGEIQVVVNVAVLTEGWDCQPVSCVVLVRPCSHKGTMIQMIGRGLRKVDPERYPGIVKTDCIVMDFGYSLLTHRDIEQKIDVANQEGGKDCPGCGAHVPASVYECAICGHEWPKPDAEQAGGREPGSDDEPAPLDKFVMTEIDLLNLSPFKWEELFGGPVMVANGIDAWAMVVNYNGQWHAIGGSGDKGVKRLAVGEKLLSLQSADEFLREYGDDDTAKKSKRWLTMPPSDKQMEHLGLTPLTAMGINRYRASCMLQWKFSERAIRTRLAA